MLREGTPRVSVLLPCRDADEHLAECIGSLEVHFLLERFLPPGRPLVVWGPGRRGKPLARALAVGGRAPTCFVDLDPGKVGQEIHGAAVLDPAGFEDRYPGPGSPQDAFVLGAVGTPGARTEIREALRGTGREELRDFRMLA